MKSREVPFGGGSAGHYWRMDETATPVASLAARDAMVDEARAIVDAARERGVVLRLYGGLGVRAWCDVVAFCDRDYSDFDLIGRRRQQGDVRRFFRDLGFEENVHVGQATRGNQLQFVRPCAHGTLPDGLPVHPDDHVDVFLDSFRMDHELHLKDRLEVEDYTIPVSDQLLTKLQVHKPDEKDVRDVLTLLKDLEVAADDGPGVIGLSYIAGRCADDWGLHHDVELNLDRVEALLPQYLLTPDEEARVRGGLDSLRAALGAAPKSLGWRLRAKVGERRPWHNDVEEQGGDL
jgi:hypothetical protein